MSSVLALKSAWRKWWRLYTRTDSQTETLLSEDLRQASCHASPAQQPLEMWRWREACTSTGSCPVSRAWLWHSSQLHVTTYTACTTKRKTGQLSGRFCSAADETASRSLGTRQLTKWMWDPRGPRGPVWAGPALGDGARRCGGSVLLQKQSQSARRPPFSVTCEAAKHVLLACWCNPDAVLLATLSVLSQVALLSPEP